MRPKVSDTNGLSPAVPRFKVSSEAGYSEFWRRNKSPIENIELANLLVSLRKISSYVGRNVGSIVWTGMEYKDGIALDPALARGRYPVPAAKTDRLVGITVQRAYLRTEWSERFRDVALTKVKLSARYAYKFGLFYDMCERVYADLLSNRSVLAIYTEYARKMALQNMHDVASHPPTINELLHVWWDMAADRSGVRHREAYIDRSVRGLSAHTSLEKYYKEPIAILNSIVGDLLDTCPRMHGVTERGNFRINRYLSIWPELFAHIQFWPTDSKDPFLQFRKIGKNLLKMENVPEEAPDPDSPGLFFAKEVEKALGKKNPDFTDRVKEILEGRQEVIRVEGNDIVMQVQNRVNRKLLHNLQFVLKAVSQRKMVATRGLKTGKIDRRRLYRASTTGSVFQTRRDAFELVNDVILLVDATGSMASLKRWEKAEEIFQTLFTALKQYCRNARLFAYNEVRETCKISELYLGNQFYTVLPHGKTASGEAIIAVAMNLKGKHKKPFIIHITDGASNWGCGVESAIEFCKKKRIHLLTLGMGCSEAGKDSLRKEYGRLVQFVDNIDALPSLLRVLLNHSKCDL
jgi:hypothetical protein